MDKHSYNVNLIWKKDRLGAVSSPELNDNIEVATPPEFDKGIAGVWSPEHFFTAAVNSCFMTTFLAIAEYSKFNFIDLKVESEGILEKVDGKFMMSKVVLKPTLIVAADTREDRAIRIMEKAEKACLISNSIKSEIEFLPKVEVKEAV
ncbi:MAG: OsmC family protein [Bacteroidetes bacterium]|nr:OsmC family protein [Bacteroidota bacterium]